jgi:hypothetical protein
MAKGKKPARVLDAMPDTVDFRDKMYVPSLIEVAQTLDVQRYRDLKIPILDQGREGACTGFGLATVVNYLLRTRIAKHDTDEVSARMLYIMAKRYDEWPGEEYEGSSARGAMKGWHKHGVCAKRLWKDNNKSLDLDAAIASEALNRPLGAYFRVNHKDIVGMHAAITEVGVLYATATVHQGWMDVEPGDEEIRYSPTALGGHAFALVAYDREGFWIQNSWGPKWGSRGLVRLGYADWLENGTDVWVARLGAPANLTRREAAANMRAGAPRSYESYVYASLRPHVVTAENDGRLNQKGTYGLTPEGLRDLVRRQLLKTVAPWRKKRVLLYAHGGLVPENYALQYVANYVPIALDAEVYPIAFIWRSDAWTTIGNILRDAFSRRRDEGFLDTAKDFMLDRLDDTLEPLARTLGGKALWDEMKENATRASTRSNGAARMTAAHLAALKSAGTIDEVHLVGHSAGGVLLAPLAQFLVSKGVKVKSLSLWAPGCTIELFNDVYKPMIQAGDIEAFDLSTLDDATEKDDDCRDIYHKSLLYLVSGALEKVPRIPIWRPNGTPLLGLARDVASEIPKSFWNSRRRWIVAPGDPGSDARHHGDFDNDPATLLSTLKRVTGKQIAPSAEGLTLAPPAARAVQRRRRLDLGTARQAIGED